MNKILILIAFTLLSIQSIKAQYGFGTNSPDPNAVMHLSSLDSTKGIIMPAVTTAKRPVASSNLAGMLIYNLDDSCFQICDGATWDCITVTSNTIVPDSAEWVDGSLVGLTAGNIYARKALASGDTVVIETNGFLGLGKNTPQHLLDVDSSINADWHYYQKDSIILTALPNGRTFANNDLAIGIDALKNISGGSGENTAVGSQALRLNTTGAFNTAVGGLSMQNSTTADFNTAVGARSLQDLTTGIRNSGFGSQALRAVTTGQSNTAFGEQALSNVTTGSGNTAVGQAALRNNTANNNVAFGQSALRLNTTGFGNAAFGTSSLNNNTTGQQNVAVGISALNSNTTGNFNQTLGSNALNDNITGSDNIAIGYRSIENHTSGSRNIGIGVESMRSLTSGNDNVVIGDEILRTLGFGSSNTGIGTETFETLDSGSNNVAVGYRALRNVSDGSNNIGIGYFTGYSLARGSNNIIIGSNIEFPNTVDNNQLNIANIIYGTDIDGINNTISTGNIGIGTQTPTEKLDVNGEARIRIINDTNLVDDILVARADGNLQKIDFDTLRARLNDSALWISGDQIGLPAGNMYARKAFELGDTVVIRTTTGFQNGFLGLGEPVPQQRLHVNGNAIIGGNDGFRLTVQNAAGSRRAEISANIASTDYYEPSGTWYINRVSTDNLRMNLAGGSMAIGITNGAYPGRLTVQGLTDDATANAFVVVDSNNSPLNELMVVRNDGNVGIGTPAPTEKLEVVGNIHASGVITSSDERYKKDIKTLDNTLDNLMRIRGVSYFMKDEFKDKGFGEGLQIGVIAQEVEKVYPELVTTNETTGYKAVNYSKFTPILIEALKEEYNQTLELKKRIEELEKANNNLKTENTHQKEAFDSLKAEVEQIKLLLNKQDLGTK